MAPALQPQSPSHPFLRDPASAPLETPSPDSLPPGLVTLVTATGAGGLLLGLLGSRAIAQALIQLGLASEEIFRGERLPTLPSPPS